MLILTKNFDAKIFLSRPGPSYLGPHQFHCQKVCYMMDGEITPWQHLSQ